MIHTHHTKRREENNSFSAVSCDARGQLLRSFFPNSYIELTLINKFLEPEFKHEQSPELVREVALAPCVKFYKTPDSFRFEQAARQRLLAQNCLAQEILEFAAKPVAYGNAEAHLAPVKILRWKKPLQHFFEQIFCGQTAQLQIFWKTCGELYHMMI